MLDQSHQDAITLEAEAAAFQFARAGRILGDAMCIVEDAAKELLRPSTIYRPRLYIDGSQWCALYGDNLQDGVVGFGDSPESALSDFDRAWKRPLRAALTPA